MSKREGIMLCYPFEEKRLAKWPKPWIVQPKLDGDRCRALIDGSGNSTLLSSEQNVIDYVPHINSAIEHSGLRNVELDGELYRHGMLHQDIHSIVSRKRNIHEDFMEIELHVFDIVSLEPQTDRLLQLRKLIMSLPEDSPIRLVPFRPVMSLEEIMTYAEAQEMDGYEGFIVRNAYTSYVRKRSTNMMKFKPRKDDYYVIVDTVEEMSIHGEPKNALGAFVCKSDEVTFRVGSGKLLTRNKREELWRNRQWCIGKLLHVKYQHLTKDRSPRFPVAVEILDPTLGDVG